MNAGVVRHGGAAGWIGAEEITGDYASVRTKNDNAGVSEAIDYKPAHGGGPASETKAHGRGASV